MTTYCLATVVGWYLVIMSLLLLFRRTIVISGVTNIMDQPGLFLVVAFFTVIIGLLMVSSHNLWVMGWPVLVTLIGWLVLISGLVRLFFPDTIHRMWHRLLAKTEVFTFVGIVLLIIGLFLLIKVYSIW